MAPNPVLLLEIILVPEVEAEIVPEKVIGALATVEALLMFNESARKMGTLNAFVPVVVVTAFEVLSCAAEPLFANVRVPPLVLAKV